MKCQIRQAIYCDGFECYFYEERCGKIYVLRPNGSWIERPSGQMLSWEEQKNDVWFFPNNALAVLIKATSELGIKTEPQHKLEGILEATRYHLEDMRSLILKNNNKRKGQ